VPKLDESNQQFCVRYEIVVMRNLTILERFMHYDEQREKELDKQQEQENEIHGK
jgi:hypothetical protein